MNDCDLMRIAIMEAHLAAQEGEVPVGAVLTVGDQLFRGHNRTISQSDPTAHAEVVVMRAAAKAINNHRLIGARLFVTLEPCIMCVGAIVQARIACLTFGAYDPRYGAVESMLKAFELDVNHKPAVVGGVLADEASILLKEFFKARR